MTALPARKHDADEDRASSRSRRALRGVGAHARANKKNASHLHLVGSAPEASHPPTGVEALEALNRLRAANDTTALERDHDAPPPPSPSPAMQDNRATPHSPIPAPRLSNPTATRPVNTPTRHRLGAVGPQRSSPLGNALQLHQELARDRMNADEGGPGQAATQDLPIESGGRVFLETDVRPYSHDQTEQELEANRQRALSAIAETLISSERESRPSATETGQAEPQERSSQIASAPRAVDQQFAYQVQLQTAQIQESLQQEQRQEANDAETKSAAEAAKASVEKIKELRENIRLGMQALSVETVVTFFTLLLDANVKVVKQFIAPKANIPFLYHKTSKPNIPLTMAVGCLDLAIFSGIIASMAIALGVLMLVFLPAVLFNIFTIIYGIYAALFS